MGLLFIPKGIMTAGAALSEKKLPIKTGRAAPETSTPGRGPRGLRPLRVMSLCDNQGVELPEIETPLSTLS
jgi:hypothetical protein